jgi:hypothetical protein
MKRDAVTSARREVTSQPPNQSWDFIDLNDDLGDNASTSGDAGH